MKKLAMLLALCLALTGCALGGGGSAGPSPMVAERPDPVVREPISIPEPELVVEDFIGMVYEEVIDPANGYTGRYTFTGADFVASSDVEAGRIVAQDPDAGAVFEGGAKPEVWFWVSTGPEPEPPPGGDPSVYGYYECTLPDVAQEYQPRIEVFSDGTFIMTVNLYEGMGTVKGEYEQDGDMLYCTVTERDFSGFLGDDVDYFEFWYWTDGEGYEDLNYFGDDIGMTTYWDVFIKQVAYE